MSVELQFESGCSGTEVGTAKNSANQSIDLVKTNFSRTLPDGTYVQLSFYSSNGTALVGVGDLVDWTATYKITIEKL